MLSVQGILRGMSNGDVMPGAVYRPLDDGLPSEMSRHDLVICHTMAGFLGGTDSMFHDNGWSGTESHFGVGGSWDVAYGYNDGEIFQWVPCDRRADANLDANARAISIETSDGAKSGPPAWTAAQIESIAQIIAWCCEKYGIPCEMAPDSKSTSRGVAFHRMGIDPWRVEGGEHWSNSYGKVCPGDNRVVQMPVVIDRARQIMTLPPVSVPPPETLPPVSGSSTFTLDFDGSGSMTLRIMKKGLSGTDAKSWQRLLADRGYSPGTIDGDFGPNSETALKNFQKAKGLTADGVLGPASGERLLEG